MQKFHGIVADQILTVTEPARLQVSGALQLKNWTGMRFIVETSTSLMDWTALAGVTNAAGMLPFNDPDAGNFPPLLSRFSAVASRCASGETVSRGGTTHSSPNFPA